MEDKNNQPTQSFGTKLGHLLGAVIASCLVIVLCSAVIAFTAKIIFGLVMWLF